MKVTCASATSLRGRPSGQSRAIDPTQAGTIGGLGTAALQGPTQDNHRPQERLHGAIVKRPRPWTCIHHRGDARGTYKRKADQAFLAGSINRLVGTMANRPAYWVRFGRRIR